MPFDAFLKISTLPGESTDEKHKDWIEVISYSHGVSQQATASTRSGVGSGGSGRTDHQDFSITKTLDKASPKLALACCKGEHIPEETVNLCRPTGDKQVYMVYKLTDVIVSSAQVGGSTKSDEARPSEQVSFNYGKIEWTYTATDHKTGKSAGDTKTNWSLTENKGG
jgi:type VI secretion system secreted protein Hcp